MAIEGRTHDIPWCCGLRFGYECARPKPIAHFLPRTTVWLCRLASLRHHWAAWDNQGYVPCEFHLALWLLTHWRPSIRQD